MTLLPGQSLDKVWNGLHRHHKEWLCREVWVMVLKPRQIPRPPEAQGLYACLADGSPSRDPLLRDDRRSAKPLTSDEEVRHRIFENYCASNGLSYGDDLPPMLPRPTNSVFTHGDSCPRNIMIDDNLRITGLVDWEMAGWFPDYWEIWAMSWIAAACGDWQMWMVRTAPTEFICDMTGLFAAKHVLIN